MRVLSTPSIACASVAAMLTTGASVAPPFSSKMAPVAVEVPRVALTGLDRLMPIVSDISYIASCVGVMLKLGMLARSVPAGIETLNPAIACATVRVWVVPSALVSTMLAMSAASASVKFKVAITLVARSLKPACSILKTMASPAPSVASPLAVILITGAASLSMMVPVPLPVPMVKVVVSASSSVASSAVG